MITAQWLRQLFLSSTSFDGGIRVDGSRPSSRRGVAVKLESLEGRLVFSVITVNSLADGPLATLRTNSTTELREAIADAKTTFETDSFTIQFAPSLDGQTIKLTSFENDLSAGSTMPGPSGLVIKGTNLFIDGQTGLTKGITIARDTTEKPFRLFYVAGGAELTLNSVTLKDGLAKGGKGGDFFNATGGGAAGLGGAIYNDGILEILNSTLTGNKAEGGLARGGSDGGQGSGGGGLGEDGGDISLRLPENGATGGGPNGGAGGSILDDAGTGGFGGGGGGGESVSFLGATISAGPGGNGGFGGGGGSGTGRSRVFTGENGGNGGFGGGGGGAGGGKAFGTPGVGGFGGGNAIGSSGGGGAGMGGAIFNKEGFVTITNSTLTGNQAVGGTGGSGGQGLGGAVFNLNGTIRILASTLSLNTAAQGGRGVYSRDDSASLAAIARISNTIIAQADTAVDDFTATGDGLTSGINNLIGKASGFSGTFFTGDPKLGALQDNGGLTPTMALAPDSPAIGRADGEFFRVSTDQRGVSRPVASPDIGAFELRKLQTISFAALANRTFGDADFAISATSSSSLPISFTASGNATVSQINGVWTVRITGAGSATITATQGGNDEYEPATSVSQSFTIAKAASVTTTVGAGPFVYNGTAQIGGSGTVTGAGGLNTSATSLTYSANADGTGVADFTNAGTYYVTANYAGDANHTASVGTAVAIIINKADATVNVTGYSGVYDGAAHGATGSATGVGGASVGTLDLGATFTNVPGGTARWTFDGGRNYLSEQGDVAIVILARRITATFTAANKVFDGNTSATVTSRSLIGVLGTDAVSLTGGTATFASKNVGTWTVSLTGATLTGAAAGNYVLGSVATTTATITPKPLTGTAETQSATNVALNGTLAFRIDLNKSGIVDGQSIAQLFDGALFGLTVGGRTYSVRAEATVNGSGIKVSFRMTDELKRILAANTTANNASKAPTVALNLTAMSKDGNYSLGVTALTKLFNTSK
ncbi:MAG TPA: choice-of-anchor Q domain-containing protein [Tepidisphaeraceae bacterium]|jgi:hypothetical protein